MARAPRVAEEQAAPLAEPITETITYVPGPMDPVSVKWCGLTFQANMPKEITGCSEGTEREKLYMQLIESARQNKHFRVGNERPKRDPSALPETSEQYRAYLVDWLKSPGIDHADDLIARFAKDRELQLACEVGADDYAWIATLFMPKLHELAKADELTEGQVATIWINHGYNQLPW